MALSNYTQRYNVDDHAQWEGDWELWSGFPVAMSPSPGLDHQLVSGALIAELRRALARADCRDCLAVQDLDWRVDQETVLRPDLVVLCDRPRQKYLTSAPSLVIEILSDSTRQRDLLYKRDMYERLGVGAYLIVDPKDRSLVLLTRSGETFAESAKHSVQLSPSCRMDLELGAVFDDL